MMATNLYFDLPLAFDLASVGVADHNAMPHQVSSTAAALHSGLIAQGASCDLDDWLDQQRDADPELRYSDGEYDLTTSTLGETTAADHVGRLLYLDSDDIRPSPATAAGLGGSVPARKGARYTRPTPRPNAATTHSGANGTGTPPRRQRPGNGGGGGGDRSGRAGGRYLSPAKGRVAAAAAAAALSANPAGSGQPPARASPLRRSSSRPRSGIDNSLVAAAGGGAAPPARRGGVGASAAAAATGFGAAGSRSVSPSGGGPGGRPDSGGRHQHQHPNAHHRVNLLELLKHQSSSTAPQATAQRPARQQPSPVRPAGGAKSRAGPAPRAASPIGSHPDSPVRMGMGSGQLPAGKSQRRDSGRACQVACSFDGAALPSDAVARPTTPLAAWLLSSLTLPDGGSEDLGDDVGALDAGPGPAGQLPPYAAPESLGGWAAAAVASETGPAGGAAPDGSGWPMGRSWGAATNMTASSTTSTRAVAGKQPDGPPWLAMRGGPPSGEPREFELGSHRSARGAVAPPLPSELHACPAQAAASVRWHSSSGGGSSGEHGSGFSSGRNSGGNAAVAPAGAPVVTDGSWTCNAAAAPPVTAATAPGEPVVPGATGPLAPGSAFAAPAALPSEPDASKAGANDALVQQLFALVQSQAAQIQDLRECLAAARGTSAADGNGPTMPLQCDGSAASLAVAAAAVSGLTGRPPVTGGAPRKEAAWGGAPAPVHGPAGCRAVDEETGAVGEGPGPAAAAARSSVGQFGMSYTGGTAGFCHDSVRSLRSSAREMPGSSEHGTKTGPWGQGDGGGRRVTASTAQGPGEQGDGGGDSSRGLGGASGGECAVEGIGLADSVRAAAVREPKPDTAAADSGSSCGGSGGGGSGASLPSAPAPGAVVAGRQALLALLDSGSEPSAVWEEEARLRGSGGGSSSHDAAGGQTQVGARGHLPQQAQQAQQQAQRQPPWWDSEATLRLEVCSLQQRLARLEKAAEKRQQLNQEQQEQDRAQQQERQHQGVKEAAQAEDEDREQERARQEQQRQQLLAAATQAAEARVTQLEREQQAAALEAFRRDLAALQQELRRQEDGSREALDQLAKGMEHVTSCILSALLPQQADGAAATAAAAAGAMTAEDGAVTPASSPGAGADVSVAAAAQVDSAAESTILSPRLSPRPSLRSRLGGSAAGAAGVAAASSSPRASCRAVGASVASPPLHDMQRQLRSLQQEMRRMRAVIAARVMVAAAASGGKVSARGSRHRDGLSPRGAAATARADDGTTRDPHHHQQRQLLLQEEEQEQLRQSVQQLQRELSELRNGEALMVEAQEALVDLVYEIRRDLDEQRTRVTGELDEQRARAAVSLCPTPGAFAVPHGGADDDLPPSCPQPNLVPPLGHPDGGGRRPAAALPVSAVTADGPADSVGAAANGGYPLQQQVRNQAAQQQQEQVLPRDDGQMSEMVAVIQSVNSLLSGSLTQAMSQIQSQGEEIEELKRCVARVAAGSQPRW